MGVVNDFFLYIVSKFIRLKKFVTKVQPFQQWFTARFTEYLHFYYSKKAKALRLQLSTCFYYLAPFCVKVKGDDGIYPTPPSLIPFTTQKYV